MSIPFFFSNTSITTSALTETFNEEASAMSEDTQPPVLLEGTLRTSDQQEDRIVLVTWEHEDILYLIKSDHGQSAELVLVNSSVCTSGTFFPAKKFILQYNKLKVLLELCKTGDISFIALLNKLGFTEGEIDTVIRNLIRIKYTFL
jgi:hypothetical protein